jgi:hypothetical protein
MGTYVINSDVLYELTVITTGTTCDGNDGSVKLEITSGGTPPYLYTINGKSISTSFTSYTFTNLFSGDYIASVTDALLCRQSAPFTIDGSNTIDFHLLSTDSINNNGSLISYITNGTPPFTLYLDGDTVGTSVMEITDLPAGNYDVRIVDSSGCSKAKRMAIRGNNVYENQVGYSNVCSGQLNTPMKIYSGPRQYLNEGYAELIDGYDNCLLNQTIFSASTVIGDCVNSTTFYTGSTLQDYPSDSLWFSAITSLIESCPQIGPGNVDINPLTNEITISTNCEPESLRNSNVLIKMRIDYDIECGSLNSPCITRPTGLIDYTLTGSYNRTTSPVVPVNNFGQGQTFTTACNAWFDFNNLSTRDDMGYSYYNAQSQWTVGSVVYENFNQTDCQTVPDGSYWLQRRNSFAGGYWTNTTVNPALPNIEIVTINSLGVITAITNCDYEP